MAGARITGNVGKGLKSHTHTHTHIMLMPIMLYENIHSKRMKIAFLRYGPTSRTQGWGAKTPGSHDLLGAKGCSSLLSFQNKGHKLSYAPILRFC